MNFIIQVSYISHKLIWLLCINCWSLVRSASPWRMSWQRRRVSVSFPGGLVWNTMTDNMMSSSHRVFPLCFWWFLIGIHNRYPVFGCFWHRNSKYHQVIKFPQFEHVLVVMWLENAIAGRLGSRCHGGRSSKSAGHLERWDKTQNCCLHTW